MIGRVQIEEVLIGEEILDEAFGDDSIDISDNYFGRFHFFLDLKLGFVPQVIRKIF